MSSVLVVEDEVHLAEGLRFNLEAEGYEVKIVETGELALSMLLEQRAAVDVVVLDVMLPGLDGFTVMAQLRGAGHYVPTLILTARGHPDDVLKGFAAGADDYLTKPFELPILIARIQSLLRRRMWLETARKPSAPAPAPQEPDPAPQQNDEFVFDGKTVNFELLELRVRGEVYPLTLMEANVLRYLIEHEGRPVSRRKMLEEVWGVHEDTDTRPIDNFIVRLRRYIEDDPTRPKHLITLRGVGYRFIARPDSET